MARLERYPKITAESLLHSDFSTKYKYSRNISVITVTLLFISDDWTLSTLLLWGVDELGLIWLKNEMSMKGSCIGAIISEKWEGAIMDKMDLMDGVDEIERFSWNVKYRKNRRSPKGRDGFIN